MDGSPVRGPDKTRIVHLNQINDAQTFQTELVRAIGADLEHTEVFSGLLDSASKTLQVPAWVRSHLDHHPGLAAKLEQGAVVCISHTEDHPVPRPASAARSSVVLIPIISDETLLGAIGLVSELDGPQLGAEDVEAVRQLAQEAAPILARLQEIDLLKRRNHELASIAERAARAEGSLVKEAEERSRLDALLKMRSHLQSNAAHELRTPLAAIRGYARMILDGRSGQINDTQREYLRIVMENTNRLINLVSWMSDAAELSTHRFSLTTFDLRDVWAESISANEKSLSSKSLALTERIPEESFEVIGDREKLAYVFNELIAAAVKVSERGSRVTVEFSHGREREVMVKISASGSGIAPEALSRIFDRLINSIVKPVMQNANDTAISLSGVYDVVGMHGGRMFVNNTPGQGSAFLFTLPAVATGGEDYSHEQAVHSSRR